jgi:tripartite-type tricarboxylate transporter receptor subunit TctC
LRIGLSAAAFAYAAERTARASEDRYPTRPVTVVVPYAPGGGIDGITRMLAQRLGGRLGQSFVVENRVGAGGIIASTDVARSAGDGYTLLMASDAQLAIQVTLRKKLPYNPERDFAPIAIAGSTPFALLVNPSVPVASVEDLIKLAKSKPDELTFASSGIGSSPHLVAELFMSMTGTKMRHIPYRGTSEALTDVIGGRVDLIFAGLTGIRSLLETHKLRALGVTSRKRLNILASVPTIAESGVAGFEATSFVTLVAPMGTPQAFLTKLNTELNRILATPEIQRRCESVGYLAEPSPPPEELKGFIRKQVALWGGVVAHAGLTHSQ